MPDLRSLLTEYVGLSRAGQCETARALEDGGFSRAAAQASVEIGNLVDFNAQQIKRLVQEIGETRARANTMALALDVGAGRAAGGGGVGAGSPPPGRAAGPGGERAGLTRGA